MYFRGNTRDIFPVIDIKMFVQFVQCFVRLGSLREFWCDSDLHPNTCDLNHIFEIDGCYFTIIQGQLMITLKWFLLPRLLLTRFVINQVGVDWMPSHLFCPIPDFFFAPFYALYALRKCLFRHRHTHLKIHVRCVGEIG
jgi:hypothetical protein